MLAEAGSTTGEEGPAPIRAGRPPAGVPRGGAHRGHRITYRFLVPGMVAGKTQASTRWTAPLSVPGVHGWPGTSPSGLGSVDLADLDWRIRATTSSGSGRSRPPTTSGSATGHTPASVRPRVLRVDEQPGPRPIVVRSVDDTGRVEQRRSPVAGLRRRYEEPSGGRTAVIAAPQPAVFVIDERRIPRRYVAAWRWAFIRRTDLVPRLGAGVALGAIVVLSLGATNVSSGWRFYNYATAAHWLNDNTPPTPRWPSRSSGCSGGRSTGPWWSRRAAQRPVRGGPAQPRSRGSSGTSPTTGWCTCPPGCRGRPRPSTTRGSCRPPARARDRAGPGHSNAADLRARPSHRRGSGPHGFERRARDAGVGGITQVPGGAGAG